MKRLISFFIALILIVSGGTISLGQAIANDYESNWAKSEIDYMMGKDILSGYPDGTFRPGNNMKKSEFYKTINGLMGFTNKAEVKFGDVKPTDWYYGEVEKALGANYLVRTRSLKANNNITREEVARIIGLVFGIEEDEATSKEFADNEALPKSLKGIIGGLKKKGFIEGYPDGTFRPKSEITRAEVVKMLNNISGEIINVAGTVSKNIKTNLVVNTGDVVLKDMTIEGDLYLTEGIGEGDVTLDNVVVKGELSIKGGGANSVVIKNSTINTVSVDKQSGLIRVVFENSTVEQVRTVQEVKIELTNGTIIKLVELDGKIEVLIEKGAAIVTLDAVSKEIIIESKGTIESVKTTQDIKINGEVAKANTEVKVADGKVTGPTPAPTPGGATPPTGGSTGGGGTTYPDPGPSIEMEFSNSRIYFVEGKGYTSNANMLKLNPGDATLTYKSSNPNVVDIKANGTMKGISVGNATITVTASKEGYRTTTTQFNVTVMVEEIGNLEIINATAKNGIVVVTMDKLEFISHGRFTVTQDVYGEDVFIESLAVEIGDIYGYNTIEKLYIPKLGIEYIGKIVKTYVSIDDKDPVFAGEFTVAEVDMLTDLLTDGMMDDILYPGDQTDDDGKKTYTLSTFISEYAKGLFEGKEIEVKSSDYNGDYGEDGRPTWENNTIPFGCYEVTLKFNGSTASKIIRVDTLTVNNEATFKDALRYNINKIRLDDNIVIAEDIVEDNPLEIIFNGKTLTINGKNITNEKLAQVAPTGLIGTSPMTEGGTDGKIAGTTAFMEYKLLSDEDWLYRHLSDEEIELPAGIYVVRFAAKIGYSASPTLEVIVPEYVGD